MELSPSGSERRGSGNPSGRAAVERFAGGGRVLVQGEAAFRQHLRAHEAEAERLALLGRLDGCQNGGDVVGKRKASGIAGKGILHDSPDNGPALWKSFAEWAGAPGCWRAARAM